MDWASMSPESTECLLPKRLVYRYDFNKLSDARLKLYAKALLSSGTNLTLFFQLIAIIYKFSFFFLVNQICSICSNVSNL